MGVAACSATSDRDDGSAGTGGSSGGSAGSDGRAGSTGTGGGSGGSGGGAGAGSTCRQLEQASSAAIADVVDGLDLSCESDDDCELASNNTACHVSCGVLVGPAGKLALQAAIAEENEGRCAGFEDMGCVAIIPPCVPFSGFSCEAGTCTWGDDGSAGQGGSGGSADAGMPADGGMPLAGCLDQTLRFGWDGGFVAFIDVVTISPCRTFVVEREGRSTVGTETCQNEIATDAAIDADLVAAALGQAEVLLAFAAAPKLFGVDSRPSDGQVYRIERGDAAIEVGGPCGSGGGLGGPCTEIPQGVADLVDVLQDLEQQQRALPDCDQLP